MKKLFLIIAITLLGLLFSACSVTTYQVKSADNDVRMFGGKEIVTNEDSLLLTSLEFDGQSDDSFVFYFYIKNKTGQKVRIDPKDIFYEVTDRQFEPIKVKPQYAIDPEMRIDLIEKDMKSRTSWHKVSTGLGIVVGLASIVHSLSSDDKHKNKGREVAKNVAVSVAHQINEKTDYEMDMEEMENKKAFWKDKVLRVTDLYNGEDVGGLVFIPIYKKAKHLRIIIPIEGKNYVYQYRQITK